MARATGKPPSHWFTRNRGDWSERDYLLQLALQIYEDGLCSCGHPLVVAHDANNDGWYDVHKPQCQACASQERATTGTSGNPYKPSPGEKVYTSFDSAGKAKSAARRATASPAVSLSPPAE